MIKMDRSAPFSPQHATPVFSQQQIYYEPMYASPADQNLHYDTSGQAMMTPNQPTQARMVMSMGRDPANLYHQPHYLPDPSTSPYDQQADLAQADANMVFNGLVSPTDHLDHMRNHPPRIQRNHSLPNASIPRPLSANARPPVTRNNSTQLPTRPPALNRQASLQAASTRFPNSASPHLAAGDLFSPNPNPGSPIKRPATAIGIPLEGEHFDSIHPQGDMQFFNTTHGISPARALGPPPAQPLHFSPANDMMVTPYGQRTNTYERQPPSSASSSAPTSSSLSSSASSHHDERKPLEISDDENDSPTKVSASRGMSSIQPVAGPSRPSTRGHPAALAITRQQRPGAPPKSAPSGGRTSSKFAKVAEDPGVEGVPPGPRPMDRPGPSFACIIGQAILKSSAGGLSLEHIYRYVETAYPFFKTENAAWRNSVRHNLSIHKMFETIPRTEKFPPGKGGIWIIHEDEKCHWPEENKFIKNLPPTHPHHEHCRQTMHDRAKEQDQMQRAAREGRVYVPKKGKNRRKLPLKDDDDSMAMTRSSSDIGRDTMMLPPPLPLQHPPPLIATPPTANTQLPVASSAPSAAADFEDDGDFLPMEEDTQPIVEAQPAEALATTESKTMAPPRFDIGRKEKRILDEDEENVFTSTKRVRLSSPAIMPLAPIVPQPQETVLLDDTFITPERERTMLSTKTMSSAYRTPMLVNTSSSPNSSPMPATITRGPHLPSALHQMWTPADHPDSEGSPTSPRSGLDAAFNFQPKLSKTRARPIISDDDYVPVSSVNPPKTPLSRSSAARETKTPMPSKTPLNFGRSPAQVPPSVSALLSTPLWEQDGCLDRLKQAASSPTHLNRSPVPPTSPMRYAMLSDGSASPAGRKLRDFSL